MFSGKLKYSSSACTASAECAASACLPAPVNNGEASPGRRELSECLKKALETRDVGKACLKETRPSRLPPARWVLYLPVNR